MTLRWIAGLIRQHAYRPHGHPPPGWSIARDLSIAKVLLRRYPEEEVRAAIVGLPPDVHDLRWLYDSERFLECVSRGYRTEAKREAHALARELALQIRTPTVPDSKAIRQLWQSVR